MPNLAYLEIPDYPGISQVKGREKMHPVTAFHHKIAREIDPSGDPSHLRVHSELVVQKELDASSHRIHELHNKSKVLGKCLLHLYHMPFSGDEVRYLSIVLHNARVVGIEMVLPPINFPENQTVKEHAKISFIYEKIGFQSHSVTGTSPNKGAPGSKMQKGDCAIHDVNGFMTNAVFNYDWAEENAKGLALQTLGALKKYVLSKLGQTATGKKVDELISKVGYVKLFEAMYNKTKLPALPAEPE
jgi:type VI secretion system secreted protein Hcp